MNIINIIDFICLNALVKYSKPDYYVLTLATNICYYSEADKARVNYETDARRGREPGVFGRNSECTGSTPSTV
jgi:hypothetical protein